MQIQEEAKEEPMSKKELEMYYRKRRIWTLYRLGHTQLQIAKKLNLSIKTVSRDFIELKQESIEWMEKFTEGDIQLVHKKNMELIEIVFNELFKIYQKTKDNEFRLKILNQIVSTTKTQTEMLDNNKILKIREVVIRENDYKKHFGRTPHHMNPQVALFKKIGQNP